MQLEKIWSGALARAKHFAKVMIFLNYIYFQHVK